MERIKIAEETKTPYVLFDGDKATLEIRGVSIPEHAEDFYKTILEGVETFKEDYDYPLNVFFDFHAFNTSSARQILKLMEAVKEIPALIHWIYEEDDEDMLEAGEDYQSMVGSKFIFEEKPVEE